MDIINAKCRKIHEKDLERLMCWRMLPEITKYMNTDPKLTMEGQKKWYQKIQEEEKREKLERSFYYWLLEVDDVPAGFVSLVDINWSERKVCTGVYIAEKSKKSLRLILDVQWNLYRYSFEVLGMHKVSEEVFEENRAVNRILDMCGSQREGVLRHHVLKDGVYYNVVTRGILEEEWLEKKKTLEYNLIEFED